jgi:hypothetical protein
MMTPNGGVRSLVISVATIYDTNYTNGYLNFVRSEITQGKVVRASDVYYKLKVERFSLNFKAISKM